MCFFCQNFTWNYFKLLVIGDILKCSLYQKHNCNAYHFINILSMQIQSHHSILRCHRSDSITFCSKHLQEKRREDLIIFVLLQFSKNYGHFRLIKVLKQLAFRLFFLILEVRWDWKSLFNRFGIKGDLSNLQENNLYLGFEQPINTMAA